MFLTRCCFQFQRLATWETQKLWFDRWSLTVNGERCRDFVVAADEGVLCRVVPAGVHDLQLVEFSLNHDPELLAHLDLHTVFQPGGRHIEVRNLTLKRGHLRLRDGHTLHGFGDSQSCNRRIPKIIRVRGTKKNQRTFTRWLFLFCFC